MASKIREATKDATEEMARTGKRVTELEEEVERLQKGAGSAEKKLKKVRGRGGGDKPCVSSSAAGAAQSEFQKPTPLKRVPRGIDYNY